MPLPTAITDLNTSAASNYPAGSDSPSVLDDVQRAHASFIAQLWALVGSASGSLSSTAFSTGNFAYTGTLTGGTGVVNIGSGHFYKDSSGNVMVGGTNPSTYGKFVVSDTNGTVAFKAPTAGFGELIYGGGPGNFLRIGPLGYASGGVALMYTDSGGTRTEGARLKANGALNFVGLTADPAGAAGDFYFNSATGKFRGHNGTAWTDLN